MKKFMKRVICKAICFFVIGFLIYSCKTDCHEISEVYRTEECIIIVKGIPDSTSVYNFEIIGKTLKTRKDTIYKEQDRWFCLYYDSIEIGDTIIKRKGELIFSIHKKDTVLSFNYECDGKVYK